MSKKRLKSARINPATGQYDYFFPMEITSPSDERYAEANGLEVGFSGIGYRRFKAVMIPCKRTTHDANGRQVYLETSSEEQRRILSAYTSDEYIQQDKVKRASRCIIPDDHGGIKRCPIRVRNPAYTPGGDQPRTLRNRCEVCPSERYKYNYAPVDSSSIESDEDEGERMPWDIPAPRNYFAGDRYEELVVGFIAFVKARRPKLVPLAEKLVQEYSLTEASEALDKAPTTILRQKEVLKKLLREFLDNAVIF